MRIFLLLIALSLSAATYSQTTFTVTIPQDVATQDWVKNYVKAKLDSLNSVKPQVVALPPCPEGPDIKSISNISTDYLTVNFHGRDVFGLFWGIYQYGSPIILRCGIELPTKNSLKIPFNTLPAGEYTFALNGTTCTGSDTRKFTIK